jgi:hypothetical protein
MTATDRITLVVLNDDGTRDKLTLSSWVGIPRKHELMWLGDEPYMVVEVEYAVSEGFFGARAIEAAGVSGMNSDRVGRRRPPPARLSGATARRGARPRASHRSTPAAR